MAGSSEIHNRVAPKMLRTLINEVPTEEQRWVVLESLCYGLGLFHERDTRQTAEFVESIAERLASGKRG